MAAYVEHVQLVVSDLNAAERFYTTVFDWKVRGRGRERAADRSYDWIHVGTDETYLAFRTPYDGAAFREADRGYKGNHIGIVVEDAGPVLSRLATLHCAVRTAAAHPFRARYYFRDFDDNEIEIISYLSDRTSERNDYSR